MENLSYYSIIKNDNFYELPPVEEKKLTLQFHYGNVTYKKFLNKYRFDAGELLGYDKLQRKFKAIPYAVWALAKAISHLALAIFSAPFIFTKTNESKFFKAQLFFIVRDCQESFGHIASLFHEQFGLFHLEESQFQKRCYDCFLKSLEESPYYKNFENEIRKYFDKEYVKATYQIPLASIEQKFYGHPKEKDEFLIEWIKLKIHDDQLGEALQGIEKIEFDYNAERKLHFMLVEKHFSKKNFDTAFKMIMEGIFDWELRGPFLVKLAETHLNNGNLDHAFKVINAIPREIKTKEDLLEKLAEKRFELGDLDISLDVITEINGENEKKEKFLKKLAEKHFSQGDLDKALIVGRCLSDYKNEFLGKIFRVYLQQNDLKKAYNITEYQTKRGDCFDELLSLWYRNKDRQSIIDFVSKKITSIVWHEKIKKQPSFFDYNNRYNQLLRYSDSFAKLNYTWIESNLEAQEDRRKAPRHFFISFPTPLDMIINAIQDSCRWKYV